MGVYKYKGPKHKFFVNGKNYIVTPYKDMTYLCVVQGYNRCISVGKLQDDFVRMTPAMLFHEKVEEEFNVR